MVRKIVLTKTSMSSLSTEAPVEESEVKDGQGSIIEEEKERWMWMWIL